jgi:hypothetical protein
MISAQQRPRLNDTASSRMVCLPATTPFYPRVTCWQQWTAYWLDTVEVTGSIPVSPSRIYAGQRLNRATGPALGPKSGPTISRVSAMTTVAEPDISPTHERPPVARFPGVSSHPGGIWADAAPGAREDRSVTTTR